MTIVELARLLRRRWRTITVVVVLCVAAAGSLVASTPKSYEASAQLFVSLNLSTRDPAALSSANLFVTARVQSYVTVANSPSVTVPVIEQLRLALSPSALSRAIKASAPANQVLLDVSVTDRSPAAAAAICNAVAVRFATVVTSLESTGGAAPLKITVIKPAGIPSTPVQPRTTLDLVVGYLLGLLLAFGAAVLRDRFDDTPADLDELEWLAGSPVLGLLSRRGRPSRPLRGTRRRSIIDGGSPPAHSQLPAERLLSSISTSLGVAGIDPGDHPLTSRELIWNNIQFMQADRSFRTIALVCPRLSSAYMPAVMELASAIVDADHSATVIETNVRTPALAQDLGLPKQPGLTSLVLDRCDSADVATSISPQLRVVVAGPRPPSPVAVLKSQVIIDAVATLATTADYTLLAGGSVVGTEEGLAAVGLGEVAILIAPFSKLKRSEVRELSAQLANAVTPLIGIVLTHAPRSEVDAFLAKRGPHRRRRTFAPAAARRSS